MSDIILERDGLRLVLAKEELAGPLAEYYRRNREFLREFEPEREESFFTPEGQWDLLRQERERAERREGYRFYIFRKEEPDRIIGMAALNNVVWGAFYSCFLGYKLDGELINRGYMTTAVEAVTEFAFRQLHLHRIEGNIMPKNKASLRVLEKCGYHSEGLSKSYLKINGRWEDHIHMVKLNFEEDNQRIVRIQEHPERLKQAASWFHEKWNIPEEAYLESMEACVQNKTSVPQWYVVLDGETTIGGLGVIENDFHDRKDLTPNVCAVYVEKPYRNQGLAGKMLQFVCEDMKSKGIDTLYLITDHTSFYERYGWNFLCMVQGDGESDQIRMYIHKS